jgi:hypothetical protein
MRSDEARMTKEAHKFLHSDFDIWRFPSLRLCGEKSGLVPVLRRRRCRSLAWKACGAEFPWSSDGCRGLIPRPSEPPGLAT